MRLVDTSAWIEWLTDTPMADRIVPLLPPAREWLVPTIVQFELSKWEMRQGPNPDEQVDAVAFSRTCVVMPLTTSIALEASTLSREHGLAVADAVIYATARLFEADVVTCDAHFEGLPGVIYFDKRAPV